MDGHAEGRQGGQALTQAACRFNRPNVAQPSGPSACLLTFPFAAQAAQRLQQRAAHLQRLLLALAPLLHRGGSSRGQRAAAGPRVPRPSLLLRALLPLLLPL